jgi:cytochrome P450
VKPGGHTDAATAVPQADRVDRPRPLLRRSDGAPPPWTPEGLADPHPWFAEALAGDPVLYDPRAEIWHALRYDDVRDVLGDPVTWSVARRMERVPPYQRMVRLLTSDPSLHTALRRHFSDAYRPRRLAGIEPLVRARRHGPVARRP